MIYDFSQTNVYMTFLMSQIIALVQLKINFNYACVLTVRCTTDLLTIYLCIFYKVG